VRQTDIKILPDVEFFVIVHYREASLNWAIMCANADEADHNRQSPRPVSHQRQFGEEFAVKNTRDIVSEALIEIADIWKVDHARSIPTDNGFDWWPGDYKVSVSATRRTDGYVPETWMLSVKTDFLKEIPIDSDRFLRFAGSMSGILGVTYAWVFPPAEIWNHYGVAGTRPQLWFANTAYLTSENARWLPRFLAQMSIMQPINARTAAVTSKALGAGAPNASSSALHGPSRWLPRFLTRMSIMHRISARMAAGLTNTPGGGVPHVSSSALLGRSQQKDVLDETMAAYSALGSSPSRWAGTDEFKTIAGNWAGLQQCVCRGDGDGFSLEMDLGDQPAMIRLSTNEKHPHLGNGLHGNLKLPIFGDRKSIAERCAALNLTETMWTDIPQFGCWYPFYLPDDPDDSACLQFSSFIPNALYGEGIASLMVLWLYQRIRLVVFGEHPTKG
jgi:hypothetical protein